MLNEINDLAGQHEVIAENLSTAVVSDLNILVKSMRDDRRKVRKLSLLKSVSLLMYFVLHCHIEIMFENLGVEMLRLITLNKS